MASERDCGNRTQPDSGLGIGRGDPRDLRSEEREQKIMNYGPEVDVLNVFLFFLEIFYGPRGAER
jgi:hypothetical protein